MSENITEGGKKASIFPDVILVSLSQQCLSEEAKLLIEFDGASAALRNDIRLQRIASCPLMLTVPRLVGAPQLVPPHPSLCQDMQTYAMMDYRTGNHTLLFDPWSFVVGYRIDVMQIMH